MGFEIVLESDAVVSNYKHVRQLVGKHSSIAVVVKSNCYNTFFSVMMPELVKAGCSNFVAAYVNESIALRKLFLKNRENIFSLIPPLNEEEVIVASLYNITSTIPSMEILEFVLEIMRKNNIVASCNLELETGMNRCGLSEQDLDKIIERTNNNGFIDSALQIKYLHSHLSNAGIANDPKNKVQKLIFDRNLKKFKNKFLAIKGTLSATEAVSNLGREYDYDMVRVGTYIYNPHINSPAPSDTKDSVAIMAKVERVYKLQHSDCDNKIVRYCGIDYKIAPMVLFEDVKNNICRLDPIENDLSNGYIVEVSGGSANGYLSVLCSDAKNYKSCFYAVLIKQNGSNLQRIVCEILSVLEDSLIIHVPSEIVPMKDDIIHINHGQIIAATRNIKYPLTHMELVKLVTDNKNNKVTQNNGKKTTIQPISHLVDWKIELDDQHNVDRIQTVVIQIREIDKATGNIGYWFNTKCNNKITDDYMVACIPIGHCIGLISIIFRHMIIDINGIECSVLNVNANHTAIKIARDHMHKIKVGDKANISGLQQQIARIDDITETDIRETNNLLLSSYNYH